MDELDEKRIESQLKKVKEFSLFTNSKEKEFLIEFHINTQYLMIIGVEKKPIIFIKVFFL